MNRLPEDGPRERTHFEDDLPLTQKAIRLLNMIGVPIHPARVRSMKARMIQAHEHLYGSSNLTVWRLLNEWNDHTALAAVHQNTIRLGQDGRFGHTVMQVAHSSVSEHTYGFPNTKLVQKLNSRTQK